MQAKVIDMTTEVRKKSLAEHEAAIREDLEAFVRIAFHLNAILQDALFAESGYESFDEYLRGEWGWGRSYFNNLRKAANTRNNLPTPKSAPGVHSDNNDRAKAATVWTEHSVRPLNKYPTTLQKKIGKAIVDAVDSGKEKLTSTTVKKFIKKIVKPDPVEPKPKPKPKPSEPELPGVEEFIGGLTSQIGYIETKLRTIPDDQWKFLAKKCSYTLSALKEAIADLGKAVQTTKKREKVIS